MVARVRLDDGVEDRYALPLALSDAPRDVLADPDFARDLVRVMLSGERVNGEAGAIAGHPTSARPSHLPDPLQVRMLGGEQSNTSLVCGDTLMVKQLRRLVPGINPEEEIARFLTDRTDFDHAPTLLLEIGHGAQVLTCRVLQEPRPLASGR